MVKLKQHSRNSSVTNSELEISNDIQKDKSRAIKKSSSVVKRQVNGIWNQVVNISPEKERLSLFRSMLVNKNILHVGCTDWPFEKRKEEFLHFQLSGFVRKLDCLDTDVMGLKRMSTLVKGNYYSDALEVQRNNYDVIIVPETIEHVPNIAYFVQSLEKLHFNEIFISCPNIAVSPKFEWHFKFISSTKIEENIHPDHKIWCSPYTLVNIVEQYTNLEITNVWLLENNAQVAIRAVKSG